MTTGPRSQCDTCARYRSPFSIPREHRPPGSFCAAFPDRIPRRVFFNGLDHRYSVDGDHGLRWESSGEDFPEDAFLPQFLHRGSAEA
jgi:hypothetical protein